MPLVLLFCCHTPCWVILCHTLFQGEWSKLDLLVQRRVGYKRKKGNSNEWISFFLKRCLAESNRSTRFCRPLPNRSVKTPFVSEATISELRVQRYYFYLVPPNFSSTFFKKLSFFIVFPLFSLFLLQIFSFSVHIFPEKGSWRIWSPYTSWLSGKFYKCDWRYTSRIPPISIELTRFVSFIKCMNWWFYFNLRHCSRL